MHIDVGVLKVQQSKSGFAFGGYRVRLVFLAAPVRPRLDNFCWSWYVWQLDKTGEVVIIIVTNAAHFNDF